jgi:hypothetical protein
MAETIGGMKGGEQSRPTCATVKRSPLTLVNRENNRCKPIDTSITNRIKKQIFNPSVLRL